MAYLLSTGSGFASLLVSLEILTHGDMRLKNFTVAGTSAIVALFGLLAGLSYLADIHPDIPGYAISALIVVALFLLAVSTSWSVPRNLVGDSGSY